MMQYFTEQNSVEAVNARIGKDIDPRFQEIMECLTRHLHAFAKEIHLTQEEWSDRFLTRVGQTCMRKARVHSSPIRFWIVDARDAINNRRPSTATENTVLGPFHVENAPSGRWAIPYPDGKWRTLPYEGQVLGSRQIVRSKVPALTSGRIMPTDLRRPAVDIQPEVEQPEACSSPAPTDATALSG